MNDKRVQFLLGQPESTTFECKRAEVKPAKLLEAVVAFANSNGGILVVGLEDPKRGKGKERLMGVNDYMDSLSSFRGLLHQNISPAIENYVRESSIEIVNNRKQNDKLLIFEVSKSNQVHSLINGDTFVREGNQNHKIGAEAIRRLEYSKGTISFENEVSRVSDLQCLDSDLLRQYMNYVGSTTDDIWQFLRDNDLVINRDNTMYLKQAGLLLFSKNPMVFSDSKCNIKISRYYGTERIYSGTPNFVVRPFSIEGPLLHQIQKTVDYFRKVKSESPPRLEGATFNPSLLIPEFVFQEAVTNAVIHRDYSYQDDIHVRFFDDRIEVESPGTYPGDITPGNIQTRRFARNKIIQRILNRFPNSTNIDTGEGVDRMFAEMQSHNLYEPIYVPESERPGVVFLILLNEKKIDYWDAVSRYLDKNSRITNKEARSITGIGDTLQVTRLFDAWVQKGLVQRFGKKKGVFYMKRKEM